MSNLFVSKSTFLKERVIPSDENDHFNDGRCAYCWGSYDDDHHPVRILPCNHVFGEDCLLENISMSPTGDLCMVCRTRLFRASIPVLIRELITTAFLHLAMFLITLPHRLSRLYDGLGPRTQATFFWLTLFILEISKGNWGFAGGRLFLGLCTNVSVRNPRFNLNKTFLQLLCERGLHFVMLDGIFGAILGLVARLCYEDDAVAEFDMLVATVFWVSAAVSSAMDVWEKHMRDSLVSRDRWLVELVLVMMIALDHGGPMYSVLSSLRGLVGGLQSRYIG